jgi:cyclopropane-fatty-acyl-phospholipid synthase
MRVESLPSWSLIVPQHILRACTKPLLRKSLLARLRSLKSGTLTLQDGSEFFQFGQNAKMGTADEGDALEAHIDVHNPAFYTAIALNGSVGAAESYVKGHWSTRDLTRLIRLLTRNRATMLGVDSGMASLSTPLRRVIHWLHRNTPAGSQANIAAHYDLGNDFFAQFLDETWMYSSAFFEHENMTLAEASRAKIDRLCGLLELQADDHLLEIGTGWGGLAIQAASKYGCRVTTATISRQQFDFTKERVQAAGLSGRIEVVFRDYRDLRGQYDKLVSVEMIEAVGHHYLGNYLSCCDRLLKPGGKAALQCITIGDEDYERHTADVDFIKRYIFPGSCLVNVNQIRKLLKATALQVVQALDITEHYVRTLQEWQNRFVENRETILRLGYNENFLRMWCYYFSYCEAGFAEKYIGTSQLLMQKS